MLVVDVLRDEQIEFEERLDSEEAFEDVERLWWRRCANGPSIIGFSWIDDCWCVSEKRPFCSAAWNAE